MTRISVEVLFLFAIPFSAVSAEDTKLTLKEHTGAVIHAVYSPDGKYIATAAGLFDSTAALWDANTGKKMYSLSGHSDSVFSVTFSHDGKFLATASKDETVRIWDTATGRALWKLQRFSANRLPVVFISDSVLALVDVAPGEELACQVSFLDVRARKLTKTLRWKTSGVAAFAYCRKGEQLGFGCMDGSISILKLATNSGGSKLQQHSKAINDMVFSTDGKILCAAGSDNTIIVFDVVSGRRSLTLVGHQGPVHAIRISHDNQLLASVSQQRQDLRFLVSQARIWDANSGKLRLVLDGGSDLIWDVAFSPDGRRLATCHGDGTVKIWDLPKLLARKASEIGSGWRNP